VSLRSEHRIVAEIDPWECPVTGCSHVACPYHDENDGPPFEPPDLVVDWFAIKCLKTSQVIAEIDDYIACPFSGRCEFDNCRWNDVWYDWNWYDEEHMPELTVMGGPGFMFVQCFSETPVFYDPSQLPLPF